MFDVGCSMFANEEIVDRGMQLNEEAASSWDRGHPARLGACGDGVGAAGPRRPTGVENQDFKNQECIWSFSDPQ
jgi:hypothetical protein